MTDRPHPNSVRRRPPRPVDTRDGPCSAANALRLTAVCAIPESRESRSPRSASEVLTSGAAASRRSRNHRRPEFRCDDCEQSAKIIPHHPQAGSDIAASSTGPLSPASHRGGQRTWARPRGTGPHMFSRLRPPGLHQQYSSNSHEGQSGPERTMLGIDSGLSDEVLQHRRRR